VINMPVWYTRLISSAERIAQLPTTPATTTVLKAQTGLTAHALRVHLSLAGWHRELVWSREGQGRRVLTSWWCPPGTRAPRLPRGRPRLYLSYSEAMALLP
jgi:hypothetical protein